MLKRLSSNASANVFSGAVVMISQLGITAMAVATWHGVDFAVWGLAMSVAAIAPIFSANLSSVLTRRLVEAHHRESGRAMYAIILSGRRISRSLAIISFVTLFCAGAWIQAHSAPGPLTTSEFLTLLTILLCANGWVLLWQVRFGQCYAGERNWWPAITLACSRGGGILGMFIALYLGSQNPITVALGLLLGTCMGLAIGQLLLPSYWIGGATELPTTLEVRDQFWRNIRVLYGFAFGAVSSLITQYSIPPLIAFIEPQRFNTFYLASVLNAVVVGVISAAMSVLLVQFTRWHAFGTMLGVGRIALFSPALCAGASLSVLCVCWFGLQFMPDNFFIVRSIDFNDIRLFLALLGFQTIVRTSASGFAIYVYAAGSSRQMIAPLAIEMLLVLMIAVPLGWLFGVNALILGLMFAALVGSQFSAKAFTSLCKPAQISDRTASVSLLTAQLVGSVLWWCIVGHNSYAVEWPHFVFK